jgi:hypothetical protein
MTVKKPEEKSENKKLPKRFYIKIPKDYYSRSEAEQSAVFDVMIDQLMAQAAEYNDERGRTNGSK